MANTAFQGSLPLIAACSNGHAEVVKVLLENGALVDAQDKSGESALIAAALNDHPHVVDLLLAHGASIDLVELNHGRSALNAASAKGHLQSAKVLVDHDANIESEDINGWSCLSVAVRNQHLEMVKYLLEKGANQNVKDMTGNTLLITASSLGFVKIVEALLEGGAELEIRNNNAVSALCIASLRGRIQIVHLLLEYGALTDSEDPNQLMSPLSCACYGGHRDIVWTLLNVGSKDPKLYSLLIAILMDRNEIVKLFIDYGGSAHPSAVIAAKNITRATLVEIIAKKTGEISSLYFPTSHSTEDGPNHMEELMEAHKIINETVNSIQFQSMTSHRALISELAPAKGKEGLTLPVLLREFMRLGLVADWQTIGALLDLPAVQLRAIKNDNQLARHCTREMLEAWLNMADPSPSWEKLVEAVEILDKSKAQDLCEKFCT